MDSGGGLRSAAERQITTVPRALAVPPDVPDFPTTAAAPVGLCVHDLAGRFHVGRTAGGAPRGGTHTVRRSRIMPLRLRLGRAVLGSAPTLGHARIAGIRKGKLGHHSEPRGRVARAATRAYLMRRLIACVFGPPTSGLGLLLRRSDQREVTRIGMRCWWQPTGRPSRQDPPCALRRDAGMPQSEPPSTRDQTRRQSSSGSFIECPPVTLVNSAVWCRPGRIRKGS